MNVGAIHSSSSITREWWSWDTSRITSNQERFCRTSGSSRQSELDSMKIDIDEHFAVTIALVSGGYRANILRKVIQGWNTRGSDDISCRTSRHDETCKHKASFLAVSQRKFIIRARDNAYKTASMINWDGMYYRKDIGWIYWIIKAKRMGCSCGSTKNGVVSGCNNNGAAKREVAIRWMFLTGFPIWKCGWRPIQCSRSALQERS